MTLNIYQIDAFSRGPFSGNPAAVVPLETWLPDHLMQKIAEENNLAETAFFIKEGDGYHIRWFTPAVEVALCGHATLATASVLFTELGYTPDVIHFDSQSGPLAVCRESDLLTLDFPTDILSQVRVAPDFLIEGLGITPIEIWQGRDDLLCLLQDQSSVAALTPDFGALKKMPGRGVIVTAKGDSEFDFVSRGFFPQAGIDEDPATGSAHTTLTPFWYKRLNKTTMSGCQLSKRRGYFTCTYKDERTWISGKADKYLSGQIYV